MRARDINPGPGHSYPFELTVAGPRLFFAADDGVLGFELWMADGQVGPGAGPGGGGVPPALDESDEQAPVPGAVRVAEAPAGRDAASVLDWKAVDALFPLLGRRKADLHAAALLDEVFELGWEPVQMNQYT